MTASMVLPSIKLQKDGGKHDDPSKLGDLKDRQIQNCGSMRRALTGELACQSKRSITTRRRASYTAKLSGKLDVLRVVSHISVSSLPAGWNGEGSSISLVYL